MRILVVEDDTRMAELLRRGLVGQGHTVDVATDGIKGLEKAQTMPLDAIVLDIMLPGLDGLDVARRLRADGVRAPILMLTARDSVPDIVRGLDVGADDYLTKPFSFEVLAARLRVMARRTNAESTVVLQVADLILNTETHEVHRGKRLLILTRTEFVLLEHLMRRAGRVVSRHALIEAVWGIDRDVESNTLDVFIFQLRSKIESAGAGRLIQTVRGFGYTVRETEG
ncbi:MAG: response regulator transcription factor [Acidobacteria bacterium]|nr:response regulator transcription factor [Acidobacteriota bacterium]